MFRIIFVLLSAILSVCGFSNNNLGDIPICVPDDEGFINEWIVVGPFPSPQVEKELPDGSYHLGFYKDYLKSIGGEEKSIIQDGTVIKYKDENGRCVSVKAKKVVASKSGIVDLDAMFGHPDNVMAYASCYIRSKEDQDVWFLLGSDDGVKVWVNGKLVHSNYVGRGLVLDQDKFKVRLHKGKNTVLVKVIDMVREWGFALRVLDEKAYAKVRKAQLERERLIDTKLPKEELLWPNGIENNPIKYEKQNVVKYGSWHPDAPLPMSRGYSNVSVPTYFIHEALPEKNTGVAVVILPGGGYNDVWLDTEGHNIALVFAKKGITSLVLKYRTNTIGKDGKRPLPMDKYLPIVVDDAKQAIYILRSRAKELNIDPDKVGIGGFSAGGHLALSVCVSPHDRDRERYPNFVFLIYPWLWEDSEEQVMKAKNLPPMFIVNGQEDTDTPAELCARFYSTLCRIKVPAELHIYLKGTHGFTLGFQGHSTVHWTDSFVDWLKDINMIQGK